MLILKSLRLINFKSYVNEEIKFTDGTNIIVGPNGSGKSSIHQAIGLALFNSKEIHMKDVIRTGFDVAHIWLNFQLDGVNYSIKRSFGKESSYGLIDGWGKVLAEGLVDVTQTVKEMFKLDIDLETFYQQVIGVGQFKLTHTLLSSPSERKRLFNAVLGVDEYKLVYDKMSAVIKLIDSDVSVREDQIKQLQFKKILLDKAQREWDQFEEDITSLRGDIKSTSKRIQSLKHQAVEYAISGDRNDFEDLEEKLKDYNFKKSRAKSNLQALDKKYNEQLRALKLLGKLSADQEDYDHAFEAYQRQQLDRTVRLEYLDDVYNEMNRMGMCPCCNRPLSITEIAALDETFARRRESYKGAPDIELPQDHTAEIIKLEVLTSDVEDTIKGITELEAILKGWDANISNLEDKMLNDDTIGLKDEIAQEERELTFLEGQIKEKIHQQSKRYDEIKSLVYVEPEIIALEKETEDLQVERKRVVEIREFIRSLGPIVADNMRKSVMARATTILYSLLQSHFDSSLKWTRDYEPIVSLSDVNIPYKGLSGSQQILTAIAIQQAIFSISNFGFYIMDEPTDSLDKSSKQNLVEYMKADIIGQRIIITHDDIFDGDNIIQLRSTTGGTKVDYDN